MRTIPYRSASRAFAGSRWLALAMLSGACVVPDLAAASGTRIGSDVKQAILDCTFEVLAQSPPTTSDTRAFNPAPLVRVAGSAFCFGDGELATAAHVLEPVLGGRFEVPFVRDRPRRTKPLRGGPKATPFDPIEVRRPGLNPLLPRPDHFSLALPVLLAS